MQLLCIGEAMHCRRQMKGCLLHNFHADTYTHINNALLLQKRVTVLLYTIGAELGTFDIASHGYMHTHTLPTAIVPWKE